MFVGHVPGWSGAQSQGESIEELHTNLQEVISMLLEDGEPKFESEFVGPKYPGCVVGTCQPCNLARSSRFDELWRHADALRMTRVIRPWWDAMTS